MYDVTESSQDALREGCEEDYSCFCCVVEPTVTLGVSASDLMHCRAGTAIRIPATVTGRPVPKVTWTFDGSAETEKKNELHTLPVDSEVRLLLQLDFQMF